jgi:hypothetical protein
MGAVALKTNKQTNKDVINYIRCIQAVFRGTLGFRGRLSGAQEEHFPFHETSKYNLVT